MRRQMFLFLLLFSLLLSIWMGAAQNNAFNSKHHNVFFILLFLRLEINSWVTNHLLSFRSVLIVCEFFFLLFKLFCASVRICLEIRVVRARVSTREKKTQALWKPFETFLFVCLLLASISIQGEKNQINRFVEFLSISFHAYNTFECWWK